MTKLIEIPAELEQSFPDSVPVLAGRDIIRDRLSGANNTHCLLGWVGTVFSADCHGFVIDEIVASLPITCRTNIVSYNDYSLRKKSTIARTWNRVMRKLGYDC